MSRTSVVLDRHLKSFADGDFDGILADYSSDAVLFVPTGEARASPGSRQLTAERLGGVERCVRQK
jgi:ketosteroid isomerase-like protein